MFLFPTVHSRCRWILLMFSFFLSEIPHMVIYLNVLLIIYEMDEKTTENGEKKMQIL